MIRGEFEVLPDLTNKNTEAQATRASIVALRGLRIFSLLVGGLSRLPRLKVVVRISGSVQQRVTMRLVRRVCVRPRVNVHASLC